MKSVINILTKVGQYVYKNSMWLIPIAETVINLITKLIRRKKNERITESEDQSGGGEAGPDRKSESDCLENQQ